MEVVIGGASGFLGAALTDHLRSRGHRVVRLVRSDARPDDDASTWDPSAGRVDQTVIDRADAVVNLSGSSISRWPRTSRRADEILRSRLGATSTLAQAVAHAPTAPAFMSGSGMSWYGVDRGDERLAETAGPGAGFLADVAQRWEEAARPATEAGARTCFVRTSLVLDGSGGVLKLMLPAWRLGAGARLASGGQYMSVISRHDWVRGMTFLVENPDVAGPFNFAIPHPVTNAEFTRELARAVHRPAFLAVPGFALKLVLGGLADDLLGSLRVTPDALLDAGFRFAEPELPDVLHAALR